MIKANVLGRKVPNENMHYICIACITTDPVMRIEKKNYLQVYLKEWKYKIKKMRISRFINTELEWESESESESDTELMAKLKSDSDTE